MLLGDSLIGVGLVSPPRDTLALTSKIKLKKRCCTLDKYDSIDVKGQEGY